LKQRFPAATVDPDVLFVEDDRVVTSAGTAAGIDACLHHVRCELGAAVANKIARRMVVPPQRDGGQRQYIDLPVPSCNADSLAPLLTWMREHLAEDQPVKVLQGGEQCAQKPLFRFGAQGLAALPVDAYNLLMPGDDARFYGGHTTRVG
jgi:transcriptional regulator GlxA family with amidase domain